MRTARLLIFSVISFLFFLFFFKSPALAQSLTPSQTPNSAGASSYNEPNNNPDVPKNLHTWTQNVMIEVASSLACQLAGIDPTDPHAKCLGVDQKTHQIGFVENGGGAVGALSFMISSLYEIPVHTGDYTQYLASNFGFEKKTYAATGCIGVGFCGLTPLLPMWTTFRNIVYLIFVLVFMIIGIAIMLRIHIDPRTVMTVENQIPKLIIGLILVTFSYAIAGFLIDVMYIAIFLVFEILSKIPVNNKEVIIALNPSNLQSNSAIGIASSLGGNNAFGVLGFASDVAGNISQLFAAMFGIDQNILKNITPVGAGIDIVNAIFNPHVAGGNAVNIIIDVIAGTTGYTLGFITGASLGVPVIGTIAGGGMALTIYGIVQTFLRNFLPYAIPFLIILIALIWALFRLWLTLIQAYVFLLLDVVSAPFWLLLGLMPGGKVGFSTWFREVIANIAVFPVTITMLLIGEIFIDAFGCTVKSCVPTTTQFVPPLIGFAPGTNIIGSLIGIGIILSLPDLLKLTRQFLKAPEIDLKAVAKALSVGAGAPQRIVGGGVSTAFAAKTDKEGRLVYPGGMWGRLARGFGISR